MSEAKPAPSGFDFASRFPNASKSAVKLNGSITDNRKPPAIISSPMPAKPPKNRIRQNSAGLNRTEQAFKEYLENMWRGTHIKVLAQCITLKIGNGVRYTPDFCFHARDDHTEQDLDAYEVKGFAREDAIVKLKVAASIYPWIKFHLVTRKKGEWQIQEVLP